MHNGRTGWDWPVLKHLMRRCVVMSGLVGVALLTLAAPSASGGVKGRWSEPFTVTARCGCSGAPLIASSARHGSTVAWFQFVPRLEATEVWARRIRRDGSLAPKRKLGNGQPYASNGWIAAGPSGAMVLAWQSDDGGIHARRISPRGRIGRRHRVASRGGRDVEIRVAVDARGNATIAWAGTWSLSSQGSLAPDPPNVHVRRLSAKGNLGQTIELPREGEYHERPRVAVAPSGRATVVWTVPDSIRAANIDEHGGVGPVLQLNQEPAGEPTQLAVDARGNATVVWQSSYPMERVNVRRIKAGGKLGPLYVPAPGQNITGGGQIGLDADGNARLTWGSLPRDFSSPVPSVMESWRLGADDTISRVTPLSPPGLAPPDIGDSSPLLVVDRAGDATIAWLRGTTVADTQQFATLARRIAPNGSLGPVHTLSKPSLGIAEVRLAVDARAIVTAAWSVGADRAAIKAARFTPRR
jgi:hypothetical protein